MLREMSSARPLPLSSSDFNGRNTMELRTQTQCGACPKPWQPCPEKREEGANYVFLEGQVGDEGPSPEASL